MSLPSTSLSPGIYPDTIQRERSDAAIASGWYAYCAAVRERVDKGAQTYGDKSFDLNSAKLIDEIEQELNDVMGWGFILWNRLRALREALAVAESRAQLER